MRVACVGNSVTYGYLLPDREQTCYPAQLQQMLGEGYEVGNFGHSGATLMRNGHNPYNRLPEYRAALDFAADIAVVHLGLNDTDPRNYTERGEEFIPDYRMLIDSLRAANPKCKVYVCLMTPIFHAHPRFLSGTRDWHRRIQQDIRTVAEGAGAQLIDLYTPLHCHPEMFPDALHPDAKGARLLAETVYNAITSYKHTPLSMSSVYQSGMVLQRDAANTLRGNAPAGQTVKVSLGRTKASTKTGSDGKWSLELPAMPAGGPYTLTISTAAETITLDSIYTGEVWLCSGQSNMEWVNRKLPLDCQPAICREGVTDDTDTKLHLLRMQGQCDIGCNGAWSQEMLDDANNLRFVSMGRWQKPTQQGVREFSAIAYRVARTLADSLGCHIGVIVNAIGGSGIESWISRTATEWEMPEVLIAARPANSDFAQEWVRRSIKQNIAGSTHALQRHPFDPCYLYESSIAPLEGLTLRGVMWYQGESNAHNCELYGRQFDLMRRTWRDVFRSAGDHVLPFYTCQLSAIGGRPSWGRFRQLQSDLADADAYTHLTVTHDVGEEHNVHPSRKDTQAARLAESILRNEYEGRAFGSPTCAHVYIKGSKLTAEFSEELEPTDIPTTEGDWFEICGADGIYHPAHAKVEGNKVVLSSPQVPKPAHVRYAWRDFTRATLRGQHTALPVSSFCR